MSRLISRLISWGCVATIALVCFTSLSFLVNIDWFVNLVKNHSRLPIYWSTVTQWQWYVLWVITMAYLSIGLIALYFLHRAFKNIAAGELFNLANSLNIRRFSVLLLVQVIAKPVHSSASSVLLSINHPIGEKILTISMGSHEITTLGVAMILWVVSDLLVVGNKLQSENQQFV